jgi:fibronectin type 3 domain-containing protein
MQKIILTFVALGMLGFGGCAGDPVEESNVEQDVGPPPPANLTATNRTPFRQDLSWDPVPGAAKYVVMKGPNPGTETNYLQCCAAGPPFLATHLTANTQYCWQIKSVDSLGRVSLPSNEVCLTTPATLSPPTVTATATSSTALSVTWTSVFGAVRYNVNESVAGGPYSQVTQTAMTNFNRSGLTAGTQYCYTVSAVDGSGTASPASAPSCTTTFLAGLEGYWKLDETTGSTAADTSGFNRTATLSGGAVFTVANPMPWDPMDDDLARLDVSAPGAVATTPSGIGAFRFTGANAFSIAFWVRLKATPAIMISMHDVGSCGVGTRGWEISQGANGLQFVGEAGTELFGTTLAVDTWHHIAVVFDGTQGGPLHLYLDGVQVAMPNYTAANHLSGAVQFGQPAGCTTGGSILNDIQILSRPLSAAEVQLLGQVPPAPSDLAATSVLSRRVDLSWTDPTSGADKWIIMKGTAPGNEGFLTHAVNPPSTYRASNLTAGTQYTFEVRTVKNGLMSLPSNEVLVMTQPPPATPTNVTATATASTRITVAWDAVTNAAHYLVYKSTAGAGGPYSLVTSVSAPTTSFSVNGLTANTQYWFEVAAQDATLATSANSSPATATTLP